MDFLSVFQEAWAFRALVASSLVGIMCGALGAFIVLRNMSLIGDALSHAILPGVVVAFIVVGYSPLGFFTGAVIAGLLAAFGITWIQQVVRTKNDAAIGIIFTAMFSLGVIGISRISKNEGVHLDLKDFLFGNVLTVSDDELTLTVAVTMFVLLSIMVFYRHLFISTFQEVIARTMGISVRFVHYFLMLLLSFAVVASLQTVGVILVVAMLITPASTALLLSDRLKVVIVLSSLIGLLSAISGLLISIAFETTPGPAMAVAATVFYLLAAFMAPSKGILARFAASVHQQKKIELEDIIKHSLKLQMSGSLSSASLAEATGISSGKLNRHIRQLENRNLLTTRKNGLQLTDEGMAQANKMIRAHRLWETYLVDQVGLNTEQIHDDAEVYEHLLTEEMLDEVDRELGFPRKDPHGSPIPPRSETVTEFLGGLPIGARVSISHGQTDAEGLRKLWELGIKPGAVCRVAEINHSQVIIEIQGETIALSKKDANSIRISGGNYSSSSPI